MKIVTLISLILISTTSFAEGGKNFEKRKAERIAQLDKRISILTKHKSCLSSASDKTAMKECGNTKKASMESLKSENKAAKAKRKQMRAERKANKEKTN